MSHMLIPLVIVFYPVLKPNRHLSFFFFFNDTATPEIYPLPLHAALPISVERNRRLTAEALGFALDEDVRYGLRAEGASPLEQDSSYAVFLTMTSRKDKLWPESR